MALRIAALQLRASKDHASTLERAARLIDMAVGNGSRLICLPEAWTGLYGVDHFKGNAEDLNSRGSGSAMMAAKAAQHGVYVCGGVIEKSHEGLLYNTIAAYGPSGDMVARYRKTHLSKVRVGPDATSEGDVLEPGSRLAWFEVEGDAGTGGDGFRIGLACCFDLRFKELADVLCDPPPRGIGSDVLLYPSAWLASTGELGHWETLLKARALDNQVFTVGVNQARDDAADTVLFGNTMIVGPLGEVLGRSGDAGADGVIEAEITRTHLAEIRDRIPLNQRRRADIFAMAREELPTLSADLLAIDKERGVGDRS